MSSSPPKVNKCIAAVPVLPVFLIAPRETLRKRDSSASSLIWVRSPPQRLPVRDDAVVFFFFFTDLTSKWKARELADREAWRGAPKRRRTRWIRRARPTRLRLETPSRRPSSSVIG